MKNEINESVYDINMDKLCQNSIELIKYARNITAKQVNNVQIMTYYSLGRWIVEVQQQGKHRAEYGKKIIINLSKKLTEEFGKGFSESTLEKARKFYLTYKDLRIEFRKHCLRNLQSRNRKRCLRFLKRSIRLW